MCGICQIYLIPRRATVCQYDNNSSSITNVWNCPLFLPQVNLIVASAIPEIMKEDTKCKNEDDLGHSRSPAMAPSDRAHATFDFWFTIHRKFMRLSCTVFAKWCYPIIVYSVVMCPSVRLSIRHKSGVLRRWLNLGLCEQQHTIAQGLQFADAEDLNDIPTRWPQRGHKIEVG